MRAKASRALIATLCLILIMPGAAAQDKPGKSVRYETNLNIGLVPSIATGGEFRGRDYVNGGDLYYFCEPYYDYGMTPEISMDFNVHLKKWLKVGGKLGFWSMWGDWINPITDRVIGKKKATEFSLVGQVRFTYVNKPTLKVYSGLAAGAAYRYGRDCGEYTSKILPAYEVVPIGLQWSGKPVYLTTEWAFGSMILGGRLGIGYRF